MSQKNRNFGSISGVLDSTNTYVAVEFSGKGIKRISGIIAQYSKTSGADTSQILQGRLIVAQEKLENLKPDLIDVYDVGDKFIFDANVNDYEPFQIAFTSKFLESATDGVLTVVLLTPDKDALSDTIGRLTVLGDEQSTQLHGISINKQ